MARPKGIPRVLVYTGPNGRKYARCIVAGRVVYLGKAGSDAALQKFKRIVAEFEAGQFHPVNSSGPGADLTVMELAADYLDFATSYYQASRQIEKVRDCLKPLVELYGETPADRFGPKSLKAIREVLIQRDLARTVINRRIAGIVRAFRWAGSEERIPASVPEALRLVEGLRKGFTSARETEPVRPVDPSVVKRTLPFLPSVVRDMVEIQRLCGCRPSEVCIVRPADIDRSSPAWEFRPPAHKTSYLDRKRIIYFGPRAQGILLKYLVRPPEVYCFSPRESEKKRLADRHERRRTPLNAGNSPGTNRKAKPSRAPQERYSRDSYRRAVYRACDAAGVARWSPHRLRHLRATEVRKEFGLEGSQHLLGHARADVTQLYAARDAALAQRIALEVG
jgi:integrase